MKNSNKKAETKISHHFDHTSLRPAEVHLKCQRKTAKTSDLQNEANIFGWKQ